VWDPRRPAAPARLGRVDLHLYKLLNGLAYRHDAIEDPFRFFAVEAQVLFIGLLAVLFVARGKWRSVNGRRGVVAAGLSAALALGAAQVISHLWERPRPYLAHPDGAHLFIPASHDPSFPSDHATAAFAIAVALLLRHRKAGVLALAMALVVSVARVAVGTHYPGDIVGGAVLGTLAALALWTPPLRRLLDAVADRAAALYDALVAGALARVRPA
jgi:undecaprenyl-diphosphatase